MSIEEIKKLSQKLQNSIKKLRRMTEQCLGDASPNVIKETSLSLKNVLLLSEKERKRILNLIIQDPSEDQEN